MEEPREILLNRLVFWLCCLYVIGVGGVAAGVVWNLWLLVVVGAVAISVAAFRLGGLIQGLEDFQRMGDETWPGE